MNEPGMIISYNELKILLYNRGFRSCRGILMPDNVFGDEEVLQTMNKLALRGMIEARGDLFVIPADVASMIDVIGDPMSTYSFSDPETGRLYYCYITDTLIVVTEKYWPKEDTLRIRTFGPDEFSAWRQELGF